MATGTGSTFLSLPNEIHIHIFKKCDTFSQALAIGATCKRTKDLWKSHHKAVLDDIGRNSIIAFDDALIAVRATEIAEQQYQVMALRAGGAQITGVEPPEVIEPSRLGPQAIAPNIEEIVRVLDMQRLVDYVLYLGHEAKDLHLLCLQRNPLLRPKQPCSFSPDDEISFSVAGPGDEIDFKVYSSMYRYFTVSAVVSKAYWEPFFSDGATAPRVRDVFSSRLPLGSEPDPYFDYITRSRMLLVDDFAYFRRWACYNKNHASKSELNLVFGSLAEWLIERGRNEAVAGVNSEPEIPKSGRTGNDRSLKDAGVVQLIMMLISCHELLWCTAEMELNSCASFNDQPPVLDADGEYRRVPATFLGIHAVLDVYIPAKPHQYLRRPTIQFDSRSVGFGADGVPLRQVRPLRMLQILYRQDFAQDPDRVNDLPFELSFFQYVLQQYFGLRVVFTWGYANTRYSNFVGQGIAFRGTKQFMGDIPGILHKTSEID
ncbi:hypothetical protein TWF696_004700 [Orbilia brochopaga]|uniref:F-box domain-containing protein n=1 Tax=Orbilia brochopaga TaxID=3140254 RepID=A0AAV9V6W2_9PEZI